MARDSEHYHVMIDGEWGEEGRLGGLIYEYLPDAAHEFKLVSCAKETPQEIALKARYSHERGNYLARREGGPTGPVVAVLAICRLETCDLTRMRMRVHPVGSGVHEVPAFAQGYQPHVHITPKENG